LSPPRVQLTINNEGNGSNRELGIVRDIGCWLYGQVGYIQ